MINIRFIILCLFVNFTFSLNKILIPMDENQTNHLKAYGIAFSSLKKQNKVEWLLNYRGGSFIIDVNENTKRECLLKNVLYESLSIEKISN